MSDGETEGGGSVVIGTVVRVNDDGTVDVRLGPDADVECFDTPVCRAWQAWGNGGCACDGRVKMVIDGGKSARRRT